jgi:hypothetical protein
MQLSSKITDGPSQYDLSYSLFGHWPIEFQIETGPVKIQIVEVTQHSRNKVLFKGYNADNVWYVGLVNINQHTADFGLGELNEEYP